ncbi:disulfide isomerase-like protein [Phanerochaete sordida]|uniref:Disulfide isomerase-like protein n=1 Tax=Phanerochaete sordida TaxID=48140 RepID=A0A9P3LN66_9APHY|nr:disulfide isomerase-like protein [Phanerochaete sordida]
MLLPRILALTLALAPAFVQAGMFPEDSTVKMLDAKGFRKAMKQNVTQVVAFVAPWCGHCQRLVPEYSKAALGLYPLVPTYAVDCDNAKNKRLCAEQGVKGFPTIKLFPRGGRVKPLEYTHGERGASAIYYWVTRNIPHGVKKLYNFDEITPWLEENKDKGRAFLLNNGKHIPILWQVLGNKYKDNFKFSVHRDRQGRSSEKMGFEKSKWGSSKVMFYPAGSMDYVVYEGLQKFDSLSKFFDSVIDGTADLRTANEEAKNEEFVPDEKELEIQRRQEAQRIALAHGGFNDLIDFEKAVLSGYNPHGPGHDGYPGMMGDVPKKEEAKPEDPIHKILKHQQQAESESAKAGQMAATAQGTPFEAASSSGQPQTATPPGTPAASPEPLTVAAQAESAQATGTSRPSAEADAARAKDEL